MSSPIAPVFRPRLRHCVAPAILLLLVTGCSELRPSSDTMRSGGVIVEAGPLSVGSLQLGDCYDEAAGPSSPAKEPSAEVETVTGVPCADPHDYEVYYSGVLNPGDYPGDEQAQELVVAACIDQFASFVGIAYDDSQLDIRYVYPAEPSWEVGDRSFLCSVFDLNGHQLQGSMGDSGY